MSALTHSSAFLSAKARVAPGAAKVRAAAAARPTARRAFVVRAADKKKGTSPIFLSTHPSRPRAREVALAACARFRTVSRLDAIDRPAFHLLPRAHAPGRRPGPASGECHFVVCFADGNTFSNRAQVPSP